MAVEDSQNMYQLPNTDKSPPSLSATRHEEMIVSFSICRAEPARPVGNGCVDGSYEGEAIAFVVVCQH